MARLGSLLPKLFLVWFVASLIHSKNGRASNAAVAFSLSTCYKPINKTARRRPYAIYSSSTVEGGDATTKEPSSRDTSTPPRNVMGGADDFESWFERSTDTKKNPVNFQHAAFRNGQLRGLTRKNSAAGLDLGKVQKNVLSVPRSLCLSAPYSNEEERTTWDSKLATMLLKECQLGKGSTFYGYCSLLCQGEDFSKCSPAPPSTAPDALRHWTQEQRSKLAVSASGRALLETEKRQRESWNRKYSSLSDLNGVSKEQFFWAMEAVHSRSFRGDFGPLRGGPVSGILAAGGGLVVQLVAAGVGFSALMDPGNDFGDVVAILCGIIALAPVLVSTVLGDGGGSAVLLPFIDSANHLQEADSVIEYDPLKDTITLSTGPKCYFEEGTGDNSVGQLFVSYGIKNDEELLLNYGFLRGFDSSATSVTVSKSSEEQIRDAVRTELGEEYVRRHP